MLKHVTIRNFKCFESLDLELSDLNVLSGINSMGKSTIIQAILLLRQSYDKGAIMKGLILNDEIAQIGTGFDLLYRNSSEDVIYIGLVSDEGVFNWSYNYEKDSDFQKIKNTSLSKEDLTGVNIFMPTFSYVSADRIGPQRYYKKSYHEVFEKNQVGYRGELFADYLAERGLVDKVNNPALIHVSTESALLVYQVEAWLSEISPGLHINAKEYTEAGIVGLGYKVSDQEYTPLNVGFGLTYAAPIIISLLKANPGDLVIIENPEAHLHPKGQRKMGELISKACAGGVQVVVETHSDHLLNGIRLGVKNRIIDKSNVRLNYFYQEIVDKNIVHKKSSPAVLDDGSLSSWPDGFFDEWDKAIDALF